MELRTKTWQRHVIHLSSGTEKLSTLFWATTGSPEAGSRSTVRMQPFGTLRMSSASDSGSSMYLRTKNHSGKKTFRQHAAEAFQGKEYVEASCKSKFTALYCTTASPASDSYMLMTR
eukprot:1159770-Pelagomonas_calceolata.AAC.3